jgi:hypothetical protein
VRDGRLSDLGAQVRAEIEALHDFLTGWFSGALPEGDEAFARGLADHLQPDFEIVLPSGTVHDRDGLLTPIRQAWGTNPGFSTTVRDVRVLGEWPAAGLVLAAYVEVQTGARNTTPADNLRRSTVLFERRAGRLLWRHLHETALDPG